MKISCFVLTIVCILATLQPLSLQATPLNVKHEQTLLRPKMPDLNPEILHMALEAYTHVAASGKVHRHYLSIIDYHIPPAKKRLWVIDLDHNKVAFHTYVAHGKGSGGSKTTRFSNARSSKASSIGVFLTGNTYISTRVGYALRLRGLDIGFNNNALRRGTVMHGAWYVSQNFAKKYHRLGRSWGCPAVSKKLAKPIIDDIKHGSVLFAYYPDPKWLHHSKWFAYV